MWLEGKDAVRFTREIEVQLLDRCFDSEKLTSRPLSHSLVSILQTANNLFALFQQLPHLAPEKYAGWEPFGRICWCQGLNCAVSALLQNKKKICLAEVRRHPLQFDCQDYLDLASRYSMVANYHVELGSELCSVRANREPPIIEFTKTYGANDAADYLARFETPREKPLADAKNEPTETQIDHARASVFHADMQRVNDCVRLVTHKPLISALEGESLTPKEFESRKNEPILGFSLEDMFRFGDLLYSWSNLVVTSASLWSYRKEECLSALPTQIVPRKLFLKIVATLLDISHQKTSSLLDFFTFGTGVAKPSLFEQPLLADEHLVAWSPIFLEQSYLRFRGLRLMVRNQQTKAIGDNLIGLRERSLLAELCDCFEKQGYQCFTNLSVRSSTDAGEIDALVVHPENLTSALIIEAKSFIPSVDARQHINNAERFQRGVKQLERIQRIIRDVGCVRFRGLANGLGEAGEIKRLFPLLVLHEGPLIRRLIQGNAPAITLDRLIAIVTESDMNPELVYKRAVDRDWMAEHSPSNTFCEIPMAGIRYRVPLHNADPALRLHGMFHWHELIQPMNEKAAKVAERLNETQRPQVETESTSKPPLYLPDF